MGIPLRDSRAGMSKPLEYQFPRTCGPCVVPWREATSNSGRRKCHSPLEP